MGSLEGKICVVTGAGRGIGRAIAQCFLAEGAKVFLLGRHLSALQETIEESSAASSAVPISCDISDQAQIEAAFAQVLESEHRVDILVNNAAEFGPTKFAEEVTLAEWNSVINTNITGTFLCSQMALRSMKEKKSGHIVTIGSLAGDFPYTKRVSYGVSKAATEYLSTVLAAEAAPFGVCCNVIAPGHVEGDRLDEMIAARAASGKVSVESAQRAFKSQYKLRTILDPQDVAEEVLHLVSTEVGRKTTGEVRYIRCGFRL